MDVRRAEIALALLPAACCLCFSLVASSTGHEERARGRAADSRELCRRSGRRRKEQTSGGRRRKSELRNRRQKKTPNLDLEKRIQLETSLQCFFLSFTGRLHKLNGAVPRVAALERNQLRRREASVGAVLPLLRSSSSCSSFPFSSSAASTSSDERQQQGGPDRGRGADQDQQRKPRKVGRGDAQEGRQGCPRCFACFDVFGGVGRRGSDRERKERKRREFFSPCQRKERRRKKVKAKKNSS